jgi:signal transduction histidine kinase
MRSEKRIIRLAVLVLLLLLILALCAIYAGIAVQSLRERRVNLALERNRMTAQLCARLLDEQYNDAVAATRRMAADDTFQFSGRKGEAVAVRAYLTDAVAFIPDLVGAAVCAADGASVARVDTPLASLPGDAHLAAWLRAASAYPVSRVMPVQGARPAEDPGLAMCILTGVRVKRGLAPERYLVTAFLPPDVKAWLRQVHLRAGTIHVVGARGESILVHRTDGDAGGGELDAAPAATKFRALYRKALFPNGMTEDQAGVLRAAGPGQEGETLFSFARSRLGWTVVVEQPAAVALEPVDHLLLVLFPFAVPILMLALLAGVSLVRTCWGLKRADTVPEAADHVKADFLATVSHDLRTPLTAAQIAVSSLLEPAAPRNPDQVRETLALASEELHWVIEQVGNLLQMSRLDAGLLAPQTEVCDLTDVVLAATERLKPLLSQRRLDIDFPPEPLLVEADYDQLRTVIENLLANAHKYSPEGEPIHLRGARRGGDVVVAVRDHGIGIPHGSEDQLFARYYRWKVPGRRTEGVGLGLFICKSIITAHSGVIGVNNMADGGAEFWFSIPALAPVEREEGVDGEGDARPNRRGRPEVAVTAAK